MTIATTPPITNRRSEPVSPVDAIDLDAEAGPRSMRRELTQKLFVDLAHTLDENEQRKIRQKLVEINMPVAASIARRYGSRGVSAEDLQQVAYVGLINAVSRFDGARGKDFLTFAVPTISGELKRHFRDACWTVRPPRRIQELQAQIPAVRDRLAQRLGRPPKLADIAEALDVSEKIVAEALAANGCFTPTSLDAPDQTGARSPIDQIIDDQLKGLARTEDHVFLTQLLHDVTARERAILRYRYVDGLTQHQIADQLGVTQMQVSRLLKRLLRDLATRAAA